MAEPEVLGESQYGDRAREGDQSLPEVPGSGDRRTGWGGAALEFNAFRGWTGSMPDVDKMLRGEISPEFPERSDLQYAMVSAIAHYFSTAEDRDVLMNGLFELLMAMPVEWSQMAWTDIELFLENRYGSTDPIEQLHAHAGFEKFADKLLGSG